MKWNKEESEKLNKINMKKIVSLNQIIITKNRAESHRE